MNDRDIREALDAKLGKAHAGDFGALILHEWGINQGAHRVDVAVLSDRITGYEIKSDVDTLARLDRQASGYGYVMDRMVLVTTEKHVAAATEVVPAWWGVMVARERKSGGIALVVTRSPRVNRGLTQARTRATDLAGRGEI